MVNFLSKREVTMRKVELRMNEQYKYDIIKNPVDNDGNKKELPLSSNAL